MENWHEGTQAGHTHEPNDVTVQLDGLGRQLSELPVEPGTPESSDGPVFVDESGRRSKTYRRLGWVLAAICAVYAVTLVVAVLGGNSSAPWLPISGQDEKGSAEVRPAPEQSDPVAGTPEAGPSASASTTASTSSILPSSSATASLPAGPSASPSASSSATPTKGSSTATKPADPGASSSASPDDSSSPVVEPPPVVESPPQSTEPADPPVQEQEGAQ